MLTMQGQWGTTARENSYEDERRRMFAVKNMSTYRSEFLVLQESFKVCTFTRIVQE